MSACDNISSEIAALRADISALNNRFLSASQGEKLQNQINLLNQKIAAIKPVNEQRIIEQSAISAEALILPSIGVAIARALLPIDNKIAQLNGKLLSLGKTATQALSQAGNASKLASAANNIGSKALSTAKGAAGTASNALAKYGALATLAVSVGLSVATLNVLGGRIDAIESGQIALGNDISKILGQLLGIKADAKNASIKANLAEETASDAKATAAQALNVGIKAEKLSVRSIKEVENIAQVIPGVNASATAANATAAQALTLAKQAIAQANKPSTNMDAETRSKLNQIEKAVGNLNVTLPTALIASAGFTAAVTSAAATGVCKSSAPGGCLGNSLGNLGSKIDKSLVNTAGIGTVSAQVASVQVQAGVISGQVATNGALIKGVSAQVAGVAAQLKASTAAILGKFSAINALIIAKFAATWTFLTADRTLNVFTAAASLHNAYMLSGSLTQTLFSIVDNIGNALFKDAGGQSFSVSQTLGKSFDNWAKGAVGVTTWEEIKLQWAIWNRIYQAGTNVLNSFQNTASSILNGMEVTGGRVGKIANALRGAGAVLDNAYGWMNPQPKFNRLSNFLENLNNGASTIQQVIQVPIDIAQSVTELKKATDDLNKALGEDSKQENKGIAEPEPSTLKQSKQESKEASPGVLTSIADFFDGSN